MIDWRHWHNEPFLTGGLILAGWLYAILAGPLRARLAPGQPYPRAKAALFYAALALFYLAVGSPLDQVAERFLVDPVLSLRPLRTPLRMLLHPVTCGVVSVGVISIWHAPFLYEWTLQDKLAHVGEHLMFLAVSLLYWWPLASPSLAFPAPGYGARMLYVFGTEVGMIPVSAYVVFSRDILYPTYEYAPRLVAWLTPADDQLLAGITMKFVGMAVSMAALAVCFFKWSKSSEKQSPG